MNLGSCKEIHPKPADGSAYEHQWEIILRCRLCGFIIGIHEAKHTDADREGCPGCVLNDHAAERGAHR